MDGDRFLLSGYVYQETPDGNVVLYTPTGISMVTDEVMKNFLSHLERSDLREVSYSKIEGWFGDRTQAAVAFLQTYGALQDMGTPQLGVEDTLFVTNCPAVGTLVNDAIGSVIPGWQYEVTDDPDCAVGAIAKKAGSRTLVTVFLNPYSRSLGRRIRDVLLRVDNTVLLMAYTYDNCLHIDSLYQSMWRVPCHLCQVNRIEADLRLRAGEGLTFQSIVDQLMAANDSCEVHTPLSGPRRLYIADRLTSRIERLLEMQASSRLSGEDLRWAFVHDLITMRSSRDMTIPWELCDCYE